MLKKTLFITGAAALLIPVAASADTSDPDLIVTGDQEVRSVTVSLDDLNLRSDSAVRTADARVKRAAKQVCDYNGGYGLNQPLDYRLCYQQAFGKARIDLNSLISDARSG